MANENDVANNEKLIALLKQQLELEQQLDELKQSSSQDDDSVVKQAEKELQLYKAKQQLIITNLKIERENILLNEKADAQREEKLQKLQNLLTEVQDITKEQINFDQQKIKLLSKDEELTNKIKSNIIGVAKVEENRFKTILKTWEVSKNLNSAEAWATLRERFEKIGFIVFGMAIEFNKISAELNKLTNTAGKFDSTITDIAASNIRLGVSFDDAAKSIGNLYQDFNAFSSLSETSQKDLAGFTAQMDKAGISSDTTAKFLNTASRSMGMGAEQVKTFEKELFAFSRANGVSMKAISDGLNSVMPRLAAFGRDAPKIFKELAYEAKQMGIEMGKILDVTEKFTTFEGAAEAVGELNSVLGGNYLDSLEMLRAASDDPVKAQEMLRDALQKTGKSFDELSGQQRRMFASMLGQDLDTTAAFFKKTTGEAKEAAMTQEKFNEAVAAFTPIGEKLKNLFAAMGPVIQMTSKVFGFFVDFLAWVVSTNLGRWILTAVGAVGALAGGLTVLAGAAGTFIGSFGLIISVFKSIPETFKNFKNGLSNAGDTIKNVVKTISDSVGSVGEMVKKVASSVSSGFKTLLEGIGKGFVAFGNAIKALGNPAVLKGLLIAAGIAAVLFVIALGVKYVAGGLSLLIETLVKAGSAIFEAAAGLAVFSLSLGLLAAGLVVLGTIGLLGIGVLGLVTLAINSLGNSFQEIGEGMSKIKEGIESFMSFDLTKLTQMNTLLKTMAEHMEIIGKNSNIFSTAMMNPMAAPVLATAIAASPMVSKIEPATSRANSSLQQVSNERPIEVVVKIDSPIMMNQRKLGRFVAEEIVRYNANKSTMNNNLEYSNSETGGNIVK